MLMPIGVTFTKIKCQSFIGSLGFTALLAL